MKGRSLLIEPCMIRELTLRHEKEPTHEGNNILKAVHLDDYDSVVEIYREVARGALRVQSERMLSGAGRA